MIRFYLGFRNVGTIRNPDNPGYVFHKCLMIARICRIYNVKPSDIRELRSAIS